MTEAAARLLARLGEKGASLATDPQLDALVDGIFDRAEGRLPHRPVRREALIDRIADVLNATDGTPDREGLMRLNTAEAASASNPSAPLSTLASVSFSAHQRQSFARSYRLRARNSVARDATNSLS